MARVQVDCDQLFDGGALHRNVRIVVEGDRVRAVLPSPASSSGNEPSSVNEQARVTAPFVMPGLIDSHVHIAGPTLPLASQSPFAPTKHFLRLCVMNGVTTVRDTGNSLETIFYAREWSERYFGPRVFSAGPMLDGSPLTWAHSRLVREETAAAAVHMLAVEGVDFIKTYRAMRPGLLSRVVTAALAEGLAVAIDAGETMAMEAAEAGVASIEHIANLLPQRNDHANPHHPNLCVNSALAWAGADVRSPQVEDTLDALARHLVYVVPTLTVFRRWCFAEELIAEPGLELMAPMLAYHSELVTARSSGDVGSARRLLGLPDLGNSDREQVGYGLARMAEMVAELFRRGVPVTAGTDAGNPSVVPGKSLHDEMREMTRVGVSPRDTLVAATAAAAALLGRRDLGRVAPGACADLLVLDGDPLANIEDVGRVRAVMKAGRWVDLQAVWAKVASATAAAMRKELPPIPI